MLTAPTAPILQHLILPAPPERVFDLFCDLGRWWPLPYTFSEARFEDAAVEQRAGGHWFERDTSGRVLSWGEVRAFEPPRRLVLAFAIGPDRQPAPRGTASELEVRFLPAPTGTRLELEHRDLDRHGEGAEKLRAGMDSPQGWPLILADLRRALRRSS